MALCAHCVCVCVDEATLSYSMDGWMDGGEFLLARFHVQAHHLPHSTTHTPKKKSIVYYYVLHISFMFRYFSLSSFSLSVSDVCMCLRVALNKCHIHNMAWLGLARCGYRNIFCFAFQMKLPPSQKPPVSHDRMIWCLIELKINLNLTIWKSYTIPVEYGWLVELLK